MEQEPFSLLSPEDDKDKKDKRKKRDKFAVPVPVSENEKSKNEKPEKPEPTALDKAVAELALKKREEAARQKVAEEAEKAEEPEKPASEPEATAEPVEPAAESATEEKPEAAKAETGEERADENEEAKAYELAPTDLGGGEVIIHLQGEETREERVVPLETAVRAEAAGDEPAEPAAEDPVESSEVSAVEAAAESTAEAPEAATGGGGEVPPTEPPETGPPTGDAPEPPERPDFFGTTGVPPAAESSFATESPEAPPVPAAAEFNVPPAAIRSAEFASLAADGPAESSRSERSNARYATKSELEDAVYTATREGQNRGVLAGLIAGGAYEHFKHKRREKRQAKRMKEQARKLDKLQEQQSWQTREHEREIEQLKHTAHEAEVTTQPLPPLPERPLQVAAEPRPEGTPFPMPNRPNRFSEQPLQRLETPWQSRPIEQMHAHGAEAASGVSEALPKLDDRVETEQKEKSTAVTPSASAEQLEIPPEHRLQSSAWHNIEIDSRTGKPVENPVFEYGHEYYRERSQESGPRHHIDNAAGEAALVADALSSTTDAPGGRDGANQPMLPPSATTHVTPQTYAREKAQKTGASLQSSGPLWPYVVGFVVVIILLIAVLR